MTSFDPRPTRRALLLGMAAAIAGCTPRRRRTGSGPAAPGPDDGALRAALAGEQQLLAGYAAATPQHAAHLAHARAIEAQLGRTPSAASTASAQPGAANEAATVPALQAAALSAHVGANAALFASIAASHGVIGAGR